VEIAGAVYAEPWGHCWPPTSSSAWPRTRRTPTTLLLAGVRK
jgi:hypothetical protein